MSLSAANGLSLEILGFIESPPLGDITRRINALDIPSLGPHQILLDNHILSRFGAIDYSIEKKNRRLTFSSIVLSLFQLPISRLMLVPR